MQADTGNLYFTQKLTILNNVRTGHGKRNILKVIMLNQPVLERRSALATGTGTRLAFV